MPACNTPTTSGPCNYPADRCPLHTAPPAPSADDPQDLEDTDLDDMVKQITHAIRKGEVDPRQAQRLIAAMDKITEWASQPTDRQKADEAYLRGKIMSGIPPETKGEWDLAREIYNDEALRELASWPMCLPGSYFPDWVDAMRDPKDPKFAWRYMDRHGPWNDGKVKRHVAGQFVTRGWTGNPYEGGEPSETDARNLETNEYGAARHAAFSKLPWDEAVEIMRRRQAEDRANGYKFDDLGEVGLWRQEENA